MKFIASVKQQKKNKKNKESKEIKFKETIKKLSAWFLALHSENWGPGPKMVFSSKSVYGE